MTELWVVDLIKQVPALGVLAWIVWSFLKHLQGQSETLKMMGESCHDIQNRAIDVIQENGKILGEVITTLKMINGKRRDE